jgi:hypothetical protein
MPMRCLSIASVVFVLSSSPALAQSAAESGARFDGDWLVTMSCPNNTERSAARGYKRQFPATVKDGVLHGETGAPDGPGWLRIDGAIGADGSARLDARGRTGDPEYAVSQPPPSSPYAFHIEARFGGAHGTGRRLETRVCSFLFDKR